MVAAHRFLQVVGLALVVAACTGRRATNPARAGALSLANPVDAVLAPLLGPQTPAPKVSHGFCRRLAVDVLGRVPTPAERDHCLASSIDGIVDEWLASPAYVQAQQRYWAGVLDITVEDGVLALAADLDNRVVALATDRISYGQFVTDVVVHPAFYRRHRYYDWLRTIFDVFVGRSARPEEVVEMAPLLAVWRDAVLEDRRSGEAVFGFGVSGCECREEGCRADTLGTPVIFALPCRDVTAGGDQYPDPRVSVLTGSGWNGAEFKRRFIKSDDVVVVATADELAQLAGLGAALLARRDVYEAAADRAMRRFLGWWQTSFNRPDSDLPAVRAALADALMASGSVRAMHRTILTSLAYTMPAEGPDIVAGAPWQAGPRKLMPVQAWLTAAAGATGHPLPPCGHLDARQGLYGGDGDYFEVAFGEDFEGDLEEVVEPRPFDFLSAAQSMGGDCRDQPAPRPTIGTIEAQRAVATRLCAHGAAVVPAGLEGRARGPALEDAADTLVRRILGRPSDADERRALRRDMGGCLRRGARGCRNAHDALRWTCVRLLLSAEFATY